ncbi:Neural proliferation differentiation and control protein 1 [Takifugu flavidus]|uniref:Neural proliferation differentiation and control protein 1 n=1 Tax=Takifugu flavidus TaxID=433684 RepID=A0A5C6N3E0_9TELE|nr:Neural proliferation differentiation and control protein 1 [Takifugu flavidus]
MGQRFAPSYANLYMSEWEREALSKCPLRPTLYLRYLDDVFGIWTYTIPQFMDFINTLNHHHPSIKLKHTIDTQEINFLDTTLSDFMAVTFCRHRDEPKVPDSGASTDEENEDGDFTVYECPGLAPTGEMEVKNPLFDDSTLYFQRFHK